MSEHGRSVPESAGLFPPDAAIRRLSAENAVVMGGGCALLLEVAHPLVAAGVARHSAFRSDPLGRLQRTLEAVRVIVFEDRASALRAAERIARTHAAVEGMLGFRVPGRFEAAARYSARDPELVLWVWASLLWTTLRVHERFVAPVEREDREAFQRDYAAVARLLGVSPARAMQSSTEFDAYFEAMLANELSVTDEARAVAAAVFEAAAPLPGAGLMRALTAALLPGVLREAYGLEWGHAEQARLERFEAGVRGLRASRAG